MPRRVQQVIQTVQTLEGGGFPVRRPFPTPQCSQVDPFLLLDQMGPVDWPPDEAIGAPDHPHRGFETVTYLLSGEMEHKDSQGNYGKLNPGDVQWMTAGAGVVHSEMPTPEFRERGGVTHGFQIWVNLPARMKLTKPRYQDIPAAQIPEVELDEVGSRARLIAGTIGDATAVIDTHTPITFLHLVLQPGTPFTHPVPASQNAMAYVISGSGFFGDDAKTASEGQLVVFANDAEEATATALPEAPLDLLLLAGEPLNEPMVRYGPFVMNTQEEIFQAFQDYQSGRMGAIT
ncbi:MAG TPA: pirin family protein [Deltaproteobacteria bacterium]|nr:pirin family protein [Deltaproteobacteria bacterium]